MFKDELKSFTAKHFPMWTQVFDPAPTIVSDAIVEIKNSTFTDIAKIVKAFYNLRNNKNYVTAILSEAGLQPQPHYSVLMSFDFHIVNGVPKLIEINTNASFSLMALLVDQAGANLHPGFLNDLKQSFLNDYKLFGGTSLDNLAIVDEYPKGQKAYFEFEMFQLLFNSWGWKTDIVDITNIKPDYDFIYNRHTDFYLKMEHSKALKSIHESGKTCLSPHPAEYALLADKMLFLKFRDRNFLEQFVSTSDADLILNCVPETLELNKTDADAIWSNKKKYILKPKNSFGGKAVYRGDTLTRNKFEEIKKSDYLVQEMIPPPKHKDLKWDLRSYVYSGNIQMTGVRAYHGQITNFKELGGGFARIKVI